MELKYIKLKLLSLLSLFNTMGIITLTTFLILNISSSAQTKAIKSQNQFSVRDSVIKDILNEINIDSIRSYIQQLENFGTRLAVASNKDEVVNWIVEQFKRIGYNDVEADTFNMPFEKDSTSSLQHNIIATLKGNITDDEFYIVGGHYDSVNGPGADDNASGTAAVLEIARVLKKKNYIPKSTIKFIAFAAEEFGLEGSKFLVKKFYDKNYNIKLMINHDVIGYSEQIVSKSIINISCFPEFAKYEKLAKSTTSYFINLSTGSNDFYAGSTDSQTFYEFGYPAISFDEHDLNPNMHQKTDLLINLNMEYCTEVIKASCATLLSFINMPGTPVNNFSVTDAGNGNSLLLKWSPNKDFYVKGYNIYFGQDSIKHDTIFTTTDTSLTINNLIEGVKYYAGITSFDSSGYETFLVEKTGTPHLLPLPANVFIDEPEMHKVVLKWNRNYENDFIGYNIYRSNSLNDEKVKFNETPFTDTTFTDFTALDGYYYYYTIESIDKDGNVSINNPTIKSRVISLNQGVLVVDETKDGNGTQMKPTDEQVDLFFDSTLTNFNIKHFDIKNEETIKLADLGPFSTILWHGDDNQDYLTASKIQDDLRKYLNFGGKLFYNGYFPSKAFSGQKDFNYPKVFVPGDFVYDCLKISHSDFVIGARFKGAINTYGDYKSIFIDSSKTPASQDYHLITIESIDQVPGANIIYTYDTQYDTTLSYGGMKGMPVGIEYLSSNYKVITLSFPLYYMKQEQAKELVQNIILNKFNEATEVDSKEGRIIPSEYFLYQNYPNPFNPTTKIEYQIPSAGVVVLKVYDVLGREAATLVNEEKSAGLYQIEFNASDFSSGIYFYELRVNDYISSKKMILLK